MFSSILTFVLHFCTLLGLRTIVRECLFLDYFWIEFFEQTCKFANFSKVDKFSFVNSIFRFVAFFFFVFFYITQCALSALVHGVLPSSHVQYVLQEMLIIEYVCIAAEHVVVRYEVLRKIRQSVVRGRMNKAFSFLFNDAWKFRDFYSLLRSRNFWKYTGLLYFISTSQYDELNTIHCAFIHATAVGLQQVRPFLSTIATCFSTKTNYNFKTSQFSETLERTETIVHVCNCSLQILLLLKLLLSKKYTFHLLFYIVTAPFTLGFL